MLPQDVLTSWRFSSFTFSLSMTCKAKSWGQDRASAFSIPRKNPHKGIPLSVPVKLEPSPSKTGTPPVNPAQPGSTRGPMQGQEEGKDKTTRTKSRSFPPRFNPPGLPFHFLSMQAEHLERAINAGQLCASSPAPPSFLHRSRGHRQKIPQILEKTGHGSSSLTPTLGCVCFNRWVQGRAGFAMELLPGRALWLQGFGAARSNPGSRSSPTKSKFGE